MDGILKYIWLLLFAAAPLVAVLVLLVLLRLFVTNILKRSNKAV